MFFVNIQTETRELTKMSLDFDVSLDSEVEENPVEDFDTIKKINDHFRLQFHQIHQESASLKKKYIQHAASSSDFTKVINTI